MKKFTYYPILFLSFLVLGLGSCKKEDQIDHTAEYKEQTDDQLFISAEIDLVTIDANTAVESSDFFFGRRNATNNICDGNITIDSTSAFKLITINYNGVSCSGKTKREGQVAISMKRSTRWSDTGAVINISYKGLQVTRISDNKKITLDGEVNLTNKSGGRLSEIVMKDIVHTIHSSSMKITFGDGTRRLWQVAVNRTYSFDNGLVITSVGDRNDGNKTGISAWGTTRSGRHFVTKIVEPMIIRQDCYFRIVSAKLEQEQGDNLTITFGLNEHGEPVSCPAGTYYLKVSLGEGSFTKPFLLPY
jgi:hypothetical protein